MSVTDLTNLEATAIQVILPGRRGNILEVYLSPSRRLIAADMYAGFSGGMLVVMPATSMPNT
jgi:hypothetical protein